MPETTTKGDGAFPLPRQEASARVRKPDAIALARLLDQWMDGDEGEQRETFEVLKRGLDEGRLEGYKLFS